MFSTTTPSSKPLALLLLGAAVIRFPVDNYRVLFSDLFAGVVVVVAALWIAHYNRWVAGFLLLALLSMYYPFYTRHSYVAFQLVFAGALFYGLICALRPDREMVMDAMCMIAIINVGVLCWQTWGPDLPGWPGLILQGGQNRVPIGLMGNQNEVSAMLAFCAPAFWRSCRWQAFPVVILGLVLAKSVGGVIAVVAGLMYAACRAGSWGVVIVLPVVFGAYLMVDSPGLERWVAWVKGFEMFREHWLLGGGLGHFKLQFPAIEKVRWVYLHNDFLQAAFEMGIIAVALITGYLHGVLRRPLSLPQVSVVVVAVNAMVNFPFHIGTTAMLAITWMGLCQTES